MYKIYRKRKLKKYNDNIKLNQINGLSASRKLIKIHTVSHTKVWKEKNKMYSEQQKQRFI